PQQQRWAVAAGPEPPKKRPPRVPRDRQYQQQQSLRLANASRLPPNVMLAGVCSSQQFGTNDMVRDSPDESQTGINVRVFPALLQDRREVLTATSISGNPNAWSRV